MASSLSKFKRFALIHEGRLFVEGTSHVPPGGVEHLGGAIADNAALYVTVSQRDTVRQGRLIPVALGHVWQLELDGTGLTNGPAVGLGLLLTAAASPAPGGYDTFAWADQLTLTDDHVEFSLEDA